MGVGDEIGWTSREGGDGGVGASERRLSWDVECPETIGGEGASASDEDFFFELDVDGVGVEVSGAAGIAELPNGDERGVAEGWEDMSEASSWRKIGQLQVDSMCRVHTA